jgi:hypothetical protein
MVAVESVGATAKRTANSLLMKTARKRSSALTGLGVVGRCSRPRCRHRR